jgi:RNA polymerase sigma-70 factor (ECF subfamily)
MGVDPQALLVQAQAGDAPAFGRLLESYRSYLTVLARIEVGRRLRGKVEPGDVVQEAFMDAHRQFPQFRGTTEREFASWLRRILCGQLALVLRRFLGPNRDMRLERDLQTQLDQSSALMEMGLVASRSTPSQQASRREQAALLAEALAALPPDYRDVLILRHLEGLTFPEVAARMERNENSTHKLWARAIAALRRAMNEQG